MYDISKLIGIIKGINLDGSINDIEMADLQIWIDKNLNFIFSSDQAKLIELVKDILNERNIADEERKKILVCALKISNNSIDDIGKFYELKGIISGIFYGGKIDEVEVLRLKEWMNIHHDFIKGNRVNELLDATINRTITVEKQEHILNILTDKISEMEFEAKLSYLRKRVRSKKNIGIDIMNFFDDKATIKKIHKRAEIQLKGALSSYTGGYLSDPEIVVISLVMIAMLEYDGNYYKNVRTTYLDLYKYYSEQKIEGLIRQLLNRYRSNEEPFGARLRIINVVLFHAIVPSHYMAAFFDFIYDIYKLNFEYDLSDDLYEDFKFVYEGLRNSMSSDGDEVQINVTQKTYRLIKSTKQVIAESKYLDAVIKLSMIVVKMIDEKIWNGGIENRNQNLYLNAGYEEWVSTLKEDTQRGRKKETSIDIRSSWEAQFILDHEKIFLVLPIHKIKAQYDYHSICIEIVNDEDKIYENKKPDIREIIGGYQIKTDNVHIAQPLGAVRYILRAGDEIIYDSQKKLHRKFIVFTERGKEIKNNTNYEGTAIFCYKNNNDKLQFFYKNKDYMLATLNVGYEDTFIIEKEIFHFSSLLKPGLRGREHNNCFLKQENSDVLFSVFEEINFLVFESDQTDAKYEIIINDRRYRLSSLLYEKYVREGVSKYIVKLNILEPDIYSVIVNQFFSGKKSKIAQFDFGYDPKLIVDDLKIDNDTYLVTINTSLSDAIINMEICINEFDENKIILEHDNQRYVYLVPLRLDIYRLSGHRWQSMEEDIWIGDISQNSVLDIYGLDAENLLVYSDTGIMLEEIPFKRKGTFQQVAVGFLNSYKVSYNYVMLVLKGSGNYRKEIFCYNKCVMNEKQTELWFDPLTGILSIICAFYGKGKIYLEVCDAKKEVIYKSEFLANGEKIKICKLRSFEKYVISFYEKGLMLQKGNLIKQYEKIFYAREDFVGRFFKIKEVYFNQEVQGEFLEKMHYFNRVYVYFKERISEDLFVGEIHIKLPQGVYLLDNINPVEIEICSNVIDGTMDVYITKDGDGLFLDFEHHSIKNTLDDPKAIDIFSYTIDINGREYFEKA